MSVFGHPVLGAWIGDPATETALGWEVEVACCLRVWAALADAQAEAGLVPSGAADAIRNGMRAPPPETLRARMRRDGTPVPGLVAALREDLPEGARAHLHFGATSQDIADTALMLRAAPILQDHADRTDALSARLGEMSVRWGDAPLMGVTRMRDALPIRVADRIAVWRAGLDGAAAGCREVRARLPVQLGGPVGTLEKLGEAGPQVRAVLAARLDLADPGRAWHTERGPILSVARAAADIARTFGKMGLDAGLMAQDGVGAITLAGGASSSMPHKVNPADAELLVALARHAAALEGALAGAGLHELERSGASWAQEWIALPDIVLCAGSAIAAAARLLDAVQQIGAPDPV